jgi:radical SAM superfamily enzyme YgiQ (UPF0313 family)
MRVLLIRPPVPHHTIGLKHVMICEPLELEYVAAGLEDHEVEILDLIIEDGLEERLRRFQPDVVGTSCYISGVNEVKKLCRAAKRWNPRCVTVVGGVQAARVPEDFADVALDCIVLGDGTTIMPEIMEAIQTGSSFEHIPGLALPCGPRQVYLTAERHYMPKPDDLPFPRRDLVAHLQNQYYYLFHQPVATMKTTWGCWYKCNFCYTWKITDGMPYSRSPESIVEELEGITANDVYIVDDIFLINPGRLAKLAQLIRARGIRKKYLVYARADFIATHEEIIKEWAGLGLSAVFIGLEAATDSELEAMNKECTVDYNRRAIEVLRQHGVDTYGSLIPQPDYLPEDWERLWSFIETTGLYYVNISPLTPMPGTDIWKDYEDKISVSREAHGLWDLSHCVLPTRMPLKEYYRSLLRLYARTVLDIRRANRLTLRTRPPVWSPKYLRLWLGAIKIMFQFINAHRHHSPRDLAIAEDIGPEVPGLKWKQYGDAAPRLSLHRIEPVGVA